jgi:hypothetical protein
VPTRSVPPNDVNNRIITRPLSVDHAHVVNTRDPSSRALNNQNDLDRRTSSPLRHPRIADPAAGEAAKRITQPRRRTAPVPPPTVRHRADHVGTIHNDEWRLHAEVS